MKTVIGIGNPWAGDDAAGLQAARRLRDFVPADVGVLEETGSPLRLLDLWAGAEDTRILDAVYSGAPAGTLHRFDARVGPLPAAVFGAASTHGLGVAEAIELARALGRLPARLTVYGIEGSAFAPGDAMTPEVRRAVARLVKELAAAYVDAGAGASRASVDSSAIVSAIPSRSTVRSSMVSRSALMQNITLSS